MHHSHLAARLLSGILFLLPACFHPVCLWAADQPQWGEDLTRNNISAEKNLPVDFVFPRYDENTKTFDLSKSPNVRWAQKLGGQTYGNSVIAEGKVFIGTNNESPRDERFPEDRGILMCFDEKTGEFLWQLNLPKLYNVKYGDWHYVGITANPVVRDGKVYLMTNRAMIVCLDIHGMKNGNDGFQDEAQLMRHTTEEFPDGHEDFAKTPPTEHDADILWMYDMYEELGVQAHNATSCSLLVVGDYIYAGTGNGVDWRHEEMGNPDAPNLVVLEKDTGKLVAVDDFQLGTTVFHGQWSAPVYFEYEGRPTICYATGVAILFGFDPVKKENLPADGTPLKILPRWMFNGHPDAQQSPDVPIEMGHYSKSYLVVGNPIPYKNRIYVPVTQNIFHGPDLGWLIAFEPEGEGDITRKTLVWSFEEIGACPASPAIADDILYMPGDNGILYALDADTGKELWRENVGKPAWGSPLVADGKVYVTTGRRTMMVMKHGREKELISTVRLDAPSYTTPTAANGTLYISTLKTLVAVEKEK